MPFFDRDALRFHYQSRGAGLPFFFQHGLGGDVNQPFGLYRPPPGVRLLAFDMRAHGETRPVGAESSLSIAMFADDMVALMDELEIDTAVVGGISLGAAVAANLAIRFPTRLVGLVLSRPAWIDRPIARNVQLYGNIARLIRQHGAHHGLEHFRLLPEFETMQRESPDCASSLVGQFEQARARECVARLEQLPCSSPCDDRSEYGSIVAPTLVLGNRLDPVHPWPFAVELAGLIPRAELRELTPKSVRVEAHSADVQAAIDDFLTRHFLSSRDSSC